MSDDQDRDLSLIKGLIGLQIKSCLNRAKYALGKKDYKRVVLLNHTADFWEGILDRLTRAEIRWPESGGEGS